MATLGDSGPVSLKKPDDRLLYAVGAAATLCAAIYLPIMLGPRGFLGALLLLAVGILLGIAAVLGGVVLIFLLVTKEAQPAADSTPSTEPPQLDLTAADQALPDPERRQQEHDSIVQEMLQGAGERKPPHPYVTAGRYSGWVWTIPSSKYDNSEAIANWPPATLGIGAVATKWWASLRGRTLYLARSSGLEKTYLVPVVEVDLKGCQVEVVKDGLKTKSMWWRKCPLQISNADRQLLHGEQSFTLFAEGSAAKEQWYAALREAAGSAPSREAVEALYARFCDLARAGGSAPRYPQVTGDEDSEPLSNRPSGLSPAASLKAPGQAGKGWGGFFARRKSQKQQPRAGSPLKGRSLHRSDTSGKAGFVNPLELDKAWMGKGALPKHLAAPSPDPAEQEAAASPDGGKEASQDNSSSSGPREPSGSSPITQEQAVGQESQEALLAEPSAAQPASEVPNSPDRRLQGNDSRELEDHEAQHADALHRPSPQASPVASALRLPAEHEGPGSEGSPTGGSESPLGGISPTPRQHSLPPAAIEQMVNMALARMAFDLLRNPAVKSALQARIHKKLNELRMPTYIHGFEVVDLKMGSTPPAIHNLKATASPTATLWPQLTFDLDYEGDISLVIEAKVDLRDGAAWSQFDRAINRLEGGAPSGGSPEAVTPYDSEDDANDETVAAAVNEEGGKANPGQRKGFLVTALRQRMAKGIRQLAEVTADHLSRMQLRLQLDIKALKGPMCVWMPPPPGDRLWFSFVKPPQLETTATPLVGGRLLKYSYQASRASRWVAGKLQSSITKNLVYPSCSDIVLPFLLSLDHPDYSFAPPHFLAPAKDEEKSKGSKRRSTQAPASPGPVQTDPADVEAKLGAALQQAEAATAALDSLGSSPVDRGMIVSPGKKEGGKGVQVEESSPKKNPQSSEPQSLSSTPKQAAAQPDSSQQRETAAQAEPSQSEVPTPVVEQQEASAHGNHIDESPAAEASGTTAEAELEEQPAGVSGHGQVAPIKVRGTSLLSAAGSSPQAGPHTPSPAQAGVSHSAEVPAPLEQPGIAQQLHQSDAVEEPPLPVEEPRFVTQVSSSSSSHHASSTTTSSQVVMQEWTPAEVFFQDAPQTPSGRGAASAELVDISKEAPDVADDFPAAGSSPGMAGEDFLGRQDSGSRSARDGRQANSWQQRLNATGSVMQKNWEAFKTRNPNTMEQGKKFAGAVDRLRGQAQEQLRRTQEQIRKNQELRKTQRTPVGQKPAQKEA